MPRRSPLALVLAVAGLAALTAAELPPTSATPKKPVTDEYHGVKVVDNYRWLEDANDPAVRKWTEEQNRHTDAYFKQLPAMDALRKRVKGLLSAASSDYFALRYRGGRLFALKAQPPAEQPFLVTLKSADEPQGEQVVLDPNKLNPKGTTAIDFYVPSLDGRLVAVSLSEGGTEDGTVHVYEVAGGKELPDVIPRVNGGTAGGSAAWNADGTGFWYTRYPRGDERPKEDLDFYQQVYYHKLGTPTEQDAYTLGKDFPRIAEVQLATSDDGRHVLASVANGDGGEFAHYLLGPSGRWAQVTRFADRVTGAALGVDESLYLLSRNGAPRGKVLRLPLAAPRLDQAREIVPESEAAVEGFVPTAN